MFFKLMYITNDIKVASLAQTNGVDRIWIDLETLGKEDRQKNMNTVKSDHTIEDIYKVKSVLSTSELLVRINPWNVNSKKEIEDVIKAGADIIMLPMWKNLIDVQYFLQSVQGRTKTILLLETKEAVECIDEVLENGGFDEIHIGLNDLHLSYKLSFMFELLVNGTVEKLCSKFKKYKIPYGFGGIANIGEGLLPAEKIIIEHYRLGSSRVILSRSFCDYKKIENEKKVERIFQLNMNKLKKFENTLKYMNEEDFNRNKHEIYRIVQNIVINRGENNVNIK